MAYIFYRVYFTRSTKFVDNFFLKHFVLAATERNSNNFLHEIYFPLDRIIYLNTCGFSLENVNFFHLPLQIRIFPFSLINIQEIIFFLFTKMYFYQIQLHIAQKKSST